MHALLVTLGAFALILLLGRVKVPLAAAILAGAAVCGLGLGMPPIELLRCVGEAIVQPRTIGLVVIISCLLGLSGTMQTGGQMRRIVELAQRLFRRGVVTIAALPALIGMLPMPGGALFSAPMVDSAAGKGRVAPEKLSAINYWFRHVWEYWWPLFPGVIVAVAVTSSSVGSFLVFHFPLSVFTIASGLLILRKIHPDLHATAPPPPSGTKRRFLMQTSSIWIVLLTWVIVKPLLWSLFPSLRASSGESGVTSSEKAIAAVNTYLPILVGLIISLIWTTRINRINRRMAIKIWTDRRIPGIILLVCSVMIFQYILDASDAPVRISKELRDLHVPVLAVFAILPFIAGMVTGIAVGFVGTSFPILMGLLATSGGGPPGPYIALAYLFGHMGQMISPLHLCQVVSHRYFKTSFAAGYRELLPAVGMTVALGVTYIAVLMLLMK